MFTLITDSPTHKETQEDRDSPDLTHEQVNDGYMDGLLPPLDAQVVLIGCEGAGKTCLADTFLGKGFHDTPSTEGADQFEITIKTTSDWKLMSEEEKMADLEKQALLETEFFLSSKEDDLAMLPQLSSPLTAEATTNTSLSTNPSLPATNSTAMPLSDDTSTLPVTHSVAKKKMMILTLADFQQLKSLQEKYDPNKRYINLWDFAGQQVLLICNFTFPSGFSYDPLVTNCKCQIYILVDYVYAYTCKCTNMGSNNWGLPII